MRFAYLLTSGALALASPALAQTEQPGRTPLPTPTPTAAPAAPAMSSTPAIPPAAPSGVQQTTPSGAPVAGGTPPPAAAPAAPPVPIGPSVGATVYGVAGAPVGTITAMDSQYVTLKTDKGEVKLPVAGVGPGLKGPVIGLTDAQLDAAVTQAQAAQPAAATTQSKTTTHSNTTKKRRR